MPIGCVNLGSGMQSLQGCTKTGTQSSHTTCWFEFASGFGRDLGICIVPGLVAVPCEGAYAILMLACSDMLLGKARQQQLRQWSGDEHQQHKSSPPRGLVAE